MIETDLGKAGVICSCFGSSMEQELGAGCRIMLSEATEASWVSEIWGPFLSVKLSIADVSSLLFCND